MCKARDILALVFLSAFALIGRAQSVEQWIAWGDAAFARGEHYGASRFYAGALQLDPGRMSLQWKQAEACRLSNQYPQAIDLYERVYQKDAGRSHREALKWLGEMQMCDGRYDDAEATWNKVDQKEKDKMSVTARRAHNAIAGCRKAAEARSTEYEVAHLPGPVNTNDSEFGARTGPDSVLWFTSLRGELNDLGEVQDTSAYRVGIYSSRPAPQGWTEPIAEAAQPDAMGRSNANLMWTPGGERMYFTMIDADGTKHIATRTPNSPAQVLNGLEAHPDATQPWVAMIDSKTVLMFSAQGGEGGLDIWYADLNGDAVTNIHNAGQLVNSPGNEVSPSYDQTSGKLWFSSDFHAGFGGYDIFRINWRNAPDGLQNVVALNSPANDLYPVHDAATGQGWLTSNRKGSFATKGETCCNDIYRIQGIPKVPVKDTVTVPVSDSLPILSSDPSALLMHMLADLPLKLYFHNDEPEPRSRATSTAQDYGTTFAKYSALFTTYQEEQQDTAAWNTFLRNDVELGYTRLGELVKALLPILQNGEEVTLEVRGHASPLAKNDYNKNLSQRRIETLRNQFRNVTNGAFIPFLDSTATNGGRLRIKELPFGEDRSAKGISDDVNDLKRSIYSVAAARERRIEVERIVLHERTPTSEVDFQIGTVHQGEEMVFTYPIRNASAVPLIIQSTQSECDCTIGRASKEPIPPGGTGDLEVIFTGRARPGPLERRIIVTTDGDPEQITLRILGTVVE